MTKIVGTNRQFKYFREFLENSEFLKCSVVCHLVRELAHSLTGDNSLVPLRLLRGEIVLKCEKIRKYSVQDCIKSIK